MWRAAIVGGMLALGCQTATAQSWADKLFTEKAFDFGETPVGAVREHRFRVVNPYRYPVHLKSVHASCGCMMVEAGFDELAYHAEGDVIVRWEAHEAAGEQSPSVSVEFDKPFAATVQLALTCRAVDELALEPAAVEFGTVASGETVERAVSLTVRKSHCRITGVTCNCPYLRAEIQKTDVAQENASYRLKVKLSKDAPRGYVLETLVLETDPPRDKPLKIDVTARISKSLSVSPEALSFGSVQPGAQVVRRMVIRGAEPFRIRAIAAQPAGLAFAFDAEAMREVHVVPVTFTAPLQAGSVLTRVVVSTEEDEEFAELTAHALVTEK